jgi:hypothetical protein
MRRSDQRRAGGAEGEGEVKGVGQMNYSRRGAVSFS